MKRGKELEPSSETNETSENPEPRSRGFAILATNFVDRIKEKGVKYLLPPTIKRIQEVLPEKETDLKILSHKLTEIAKQGEPYTWCMLPFGKGDSKLLHEFTKGPDGEITYSPKIEIPGEADPALPKNIDNHEYNLGKAELADRLKWVGNRQKRLLGNTTR